MLGHELTAALSELRAHAESRMTSTCTITLPGEPTWDNDSGTYTDGEPVVQYEGPCRIRMGYANPQNATAGMTEWSASRGVLSVPIEGTAHLGDGMTVTITANPLDPDTVGQEYDVLAGHVQTDSTARRLPVQIVSRDAAVEAES